MEADGETPWEACRREAREESGVEIDTGRLACVDFLRPREGRPGGMRFLFDCGVLDAEELGTGRGAGRGDRGVLFRAGGRSARAPERAASP